MKYIGSNITVDIQMLLNIVKPNIFSDFLYELPWPTLKAYYKKIGKHRNEPLSPNSPYHGTWLQSITMEAVIRLMEKLLDIETQVKEHF